jgi:hypothetical protein
VPRDDLPGLAPVLAVGGEGHIGGAAEDDVDDQGVRPGGEGVVVRARVEDTTRLRTWPRWRSMRPSAACFSERPVVDVG